MEFKEKRPLYLLKEIAAILRGEGGCAWDREQTSESLRPYLIEEVYELYDAIEKGDPKEIQEELGDLFYQVYAHSQIAEEEGKFTIDDVAQGIADKLVYRHPHVFGNDVAATPEEVSDRWEKIKKAEKSHRESILDGVPKHLPALLKAYRVQQKVSRIGFDWEKVEDAAQKIEEETREIHEALRSGNTEKIIEEAGDLLFSIVNVLRFLKVNPEAALKQSVDKFMRRFKHVEALAASGQKELDAMSIDELESLWQKAKEKDHSPST